MIDFRYHLVSLVSVFMALAIGVVLGAGPLQDTIGAQLSNQVDALRADKVDLQRAVANREDELAERDAFVAAVAPDVLGTRLAGRSVVLVVLPGASGGADALAELLETGGAEVTGRVRLEPAWADGGGAALREEVAGRVEDSVDPLPAAGTSTVGVLAAALATGVVDDGTPDVGQSGATTLVDELQDAGLVSVDGDITSQRATTAVVLAPSAADTTLDAGDPADGGGGAGGATPVETYLAVAQALDDAAEGSVVAGPREAADDGGLVAAVRGDGAAARAVSTVDDADSPSGWVTTALALLEQAQGEVGHYGFAGGAEAVVPPPTTQETP